MASLQLPADVESWPAQRVVDYVLGEFPGRVALACSFQKEESVLLDMLFELEPNARVFAIDTQHLFPETYELWRAVESRYGTKIETFAGDPVEEGLWESNPDLYLAIAKIEPLNRALLDLDAWITGIRRDQSPLRADAPKLGWDEKHELWKANPLADWSDDDCWAYIRERDLPYNKLHDQGYESIGDTHSTTPGKGRDGRWAGATGAAPNSSWASSSRSWGRCPMSGFVLWFTGLSGAGKTTIANNVEPELERRGFVVDHLDGDIVRTHLSKGLGFSKEDRDTNIARIGWVASRLARAGAVVIVSAISPYEELRRHARSLVEQHAPFVEVFVATPLEECARRDPKGLYAAAFAGEIDEFTGVSAPYEEPLTPELRLETIGRTPSESAATVIDRLEELNLLPERVESEL